MPLSSCWEFPGARDPRGYGRARNPSGGTDLAHRQVFEAIYGWLPPVVRHRCDNPPCYNPAHLLPGTQADNMRDASERGLFRPWGRGKTHCPQGHEYSEANTYTYRGCRSCKTCAVGRTRARRATEAN